LNHFINPAAQVNHTFLRLVATGALELAHALRDRVNIAVTSLDVSKNEIGAAGAAILAEAIKTPVNIAWYALKLWFSVN
jgi:hypothetical protein